MYRFSSRSSNDTSPVTVAIVNWNCGSVLAKCLSHLLNQTVKPNKIVVLDNGSRDDSLKKIPQRDLFDFCLLGKNYGFAAANNKAIFSCKTEFIALLNPDAFANPNWLESLLKAAKLYPDVAMFSSLQLCNENPNVVDGAGDSYHVSGLVWREGHGSVASKLNLNNKEVFSPCAAAALYRRDALVQVDGFDEDFFCYVEDVDLGFRLRLAGYQAMLVSDAVVRHVGSVSTGGQHSNFAVYHGHRNLVWAFIKNMPGILFWVLLPLHLILNIFSVFYYSLHGQGKVIMSAKWDAIKGIPKMWRKRRIIQQDRVASVADIWRVLDKRLFLSSRR